MKITELPEDIVDKLRNFARSQMELVSDYEEKDQLETAYLARWAVLEKIVKTVAKEWDNSWEANSLPRKKDFIAALDHFGLDGAGVWGVMDSQGKARGFRNQIAHTGRKFTRRVQYIKLGKQLDQMTTKLLRMASQ